MTKTTYEILSDKMNNIGKELCQIGKENNLHRLSLLSGQLGDLKEDLARLLWLELPELKDKHKHSLRPKKSNRNMLLIQKIYI